MASLSANLLNHYNYHCNYCDYYSLPSVKTIQSRLILFNSNILVHKKSPFTVKTRSTSDPFVGGNNSNISSKLTRKVMSSTSDVGSTSNGSRFEFDVVVIGAGIIGLTIAREFLLNSDLSVAIVDAGLPCSGATGAGQGYLWMVHRIPGSHIWELAKSSQNMWHMMADRLQEQGHDPLQVLGWKKTGSLLIGRTKDESEVLKKRAEILSAAGVRAEYWSNHDLLLKEPELCVGEEGSAVFVLDDSQIDADRTVRFMQEGNRKFRSQGRYAEFFHDPAICFIRSASDGKVEGIKTKNHTLFGKKAIVVATGCWTASLINQLIGESDIKVNVPVEPRKGLLLALENFNALKLNHGVMEAGYVDHLQTSLHAMKSASEGHDPTLSISMAATIDAKGNLLLGSSRQMAGFNTELDMSIIKLIWERASEFFPSLSNFSLADIKDNCKVRAGLRPYMLDGRPAIGPIPDMKNVFLAAGHEGGGFIMALGTAELVADMVLGNPLKLNPEPFAIEGR